MTVEGRALSERRVLVVDDEANIVKVVTRILEAMGYVVLGASSVAEAAQVLRASGPVDCAVLDFSLDGATCAEAYGALTSIQPDLRVLISSGFSQSEVAHGFPQASECAGFLKKPFGLDSLVKAVASACEKSEAAA